MPVYFFVENVLFNLRDKRKTGEWIIESVRKEGYSLDELNYIFCSDKYLLGLNNHYLNHDEYTDIITFDHSFSKKSLNGEIFISIDRVKENTKTYKTSFRDELHRVMIHGVLHLCGYKDKTKVLQLKMRSREDYYLNLRSF